MQQNHLKQRILYGCKKGEVDTAAFTSEKKYSCAAQNQEMQMYSFYQGMQMYSFYQGMEMYSFYQGMEM